MNVLYKIIIKKKPTTLVEQRLKHIFMNVLKKINNISKKKKTSRRELASLKIMKPSEKKIDINWRQREKEKVLLPNLCISVQ